MKTCLIVDDSKMIRRVAGRILKDLKFTSKEAENGLEAIKTCKEKMPDAILLDWNMPIMNGWEFLEEYEKLEPEFKAKTVVIMLTSSLNPDDRDRALSYGDVDAMYNKLLDKDILADIEDKLL